MFPSQHYVWEGCMVWNDFKFRGLLLSEVDCDPYEILGPGKIMTLLHRFLVGTKSHYENRLDYIDWVGCKEAFLGIYLFYRDD